MLTFAEAQAQVLEHIEPLSVERVPAGEAMGRVLATEVAARGDSPPLDNSAMDGYAVRHADVSAASAAAPVSLEVLEDIPAGHVGTRPVGPGQASRIMTGAPIPAGADTVIRVEDTRAADGRVEILVPDELGGSVRAAGSSMRAGETVLPAGTEIGVAEVAVLAAVQRSHVSVYRRPVVAILSTGDELVEADDTPGPGQIVNVNSPGLAALARHCGAEALVLPTAPDDEGVIRTAVEAALQGDFIISSGGVSVGDYDYVKRVLEELDAREVLWRVAMKPGKPLYFALLQGRPYFGLPGNPVSSLVSFLHFVRPAIRRAAGFAPDRLRLPELRVPLEHDLANDDAGRAQFLRGQVRPDGAGHLTARAVARAQGSHVLTSMLGANALLRLEAGQCARAGDEVAAHLFGELS